MTADRPARAGQVLENRLMNAHRALCIPLLILPVLTCCTLERDVEPAPVGKPNVLFILCDDLNDYTGPLGGHPQARTPNIDRLAESGVTFANAHTNSPICSPSRNSLFTGIYPHRSKDFGWTAHDELPVLAQSKTLMEYFRENGYRVMGSGKLLHRNRKNLWDEWGVNINNYGPFAFDGKDLQGHPSVPEPFRSIGPVDGSFAPLSDVPIFPGQSTGREPGWLYSIEDDKYLRYVHDDDRDPLPDEMHAAWAANKIRELDSQTEEQPFFLAVGFVRPHTPLYAPAKFFDLFPLEQLELSPILPDDAADCHYTRVFPPERKGLRYYRALKASYSGPEVGLKHFLQAYLACVAFVDEQIGIVLDALDQSRFKDDTIVVLTSDNGWQMGEKNFLFKNSPWEESTRVPLIIRAPREQMAGIRVDQPVSLVDVFPTLADLCDLVGDTVKGEPGLPPDGFSLRPFLREADLAEWEGPQGALSMLGVGVDAEDALNQNYSFRTRHWRYVLYRNSDEELYDHRSDPYEWTNLSGAAEHRQKKEELRNQMMQILNRSRPAPADSVGG